MRDLSKFWVMSRDSRKYTRLATVLSLRVSPLGERTCLLSGPPVTEMKFIVVFRTVVLCRNVVFSDPKLLTLSN